MNEIKKARRQRRLTRIAAVGSLTIFPAIVMGMSTVAAGSVPPDTSNYSAPQNNYPGGGQDPNVWNPNAWNPNWWQSPDDQYGNSPQVSPSPPKNSNSFFGSFGS